MLVKAAPGLRVPKEGKPRQYITETDAVTVPETAYYLRALACGDLLPATAATVKTAKPSAAKAATED